MDCSISAEDTTAGDNAAEDISGTVVAEVHDQCARLI